MNRNINNNLYLIIVIILGAIFSGLIIWTTSPNNAGVSPDSVSYIKAARLYASGTNYNNFIEPPFYSLVLASVKLIVRVDPLISARYVNAVLFGLIIIIAGLLLRNYVSNMALNIIGLVFIGCSTALISPSLKIWTETLFIFLSTLFLFFLSQFIKKESTIYVILMAISAALAAVTRFMGLSLIIIGMFYLIFYRRKSQSNKIVKIILFFVVSSSPIILYFVNNYIHSGSLIGYSIVRLNGYSLHSMMYNFYEAGLSIFETTTKWYVYEKLYSQPFLFGLGLIFGLIFGYGLKQLEIFTVNSIMRFPIIIYCLIYSVALFLIVGATGHIEDRYLAPIFIPLTIILMFFIEQFVLPLIKKLKFRMTRLIIYVVITFSLYLPINTSYNILKNHHQFGYGFTDRTWQYSATIEYLRSHQNFLSAYTIYSNGTDAIYLLADLNSTRLPNKSFWGGEGISEIDLLNGSWLEENSACLVWFNNITWRDYLYSPNEILEIIRLEKIVELDDGTIYCTTKN